MKTSNQSEYYKKWYYSPRGQEYREKARDIKNIQHKKYRQSKKGKLVQSNKMRRMMAKYPEKFSARQKLTYAVKMGKIKRPVDCDMSNISSACFGRIEAHHHDYNKPLDVKWLCGNHHREVHSATKDKYKNK